MELKMIKCPKCGEDFPELRKTKYGYHVCVNCSTVEAVVGITTVEGYGDHTFNDLIVMERNQFRSIASKAAELAGQKVDLEILDLDADETIISQSIKEKVTNLLDEDSEEEEDDENQTESNIEGIDY